MEGCDDANMDDTDACTSLCVAASCGDGFLYAGVEACDDANMDDTDECVGCATASCGDGFVHADVEACDDANMDDADACTNLCMAASCGDGIVYAGIEDCDDANMDNTDGCVGMCEAASCGDGYIQANVEQCDTQDPGVWCVNSCQGAYYDDFESNDLLTLPWMTSGNALWGLSATLPHEGLYSAASGNLINQNNVSSTLQVTLVAPAPGVVRFWYKVSSEPNYDFLRFYIDNVQQGASWSGSVSWTMAQFNVGAGQHTFRWTYNKDVSLHGGSDTAWIDEVYVGP
jgi:cysteine-rich repeat protein